MSGFSADWLAAREPYDVAARDRGLLASLGARLQARSPVTVVDLGCGTGSNLRAMAGVLGAVQRWTLVDHDPDLLAAARTALSDWADEVVDPGETLRLTRHGGEIHVRFRQADLVAELDGLIDLPADLVTAAALFDLASEAWLTRFVAGLAARRRPLYTVLTYDGREAWAPPHPADHAVLAAFHRHQARDKGFGPAAGPRATAILVAALARAGYDVDTADTPWRLGPADAGFAAMLAKGIGGAAAEAGLDPAAAASWAAARRAPDAALIGHLDLLAWPL